MEKLVIAGYNIFISGGTGSGKTTFLNALSSFIPRTERIITIEDSAELQIQGNDNLVRLETRNANVEGCKPVTIRDLIRASLRMRPDRIIVGEVRGAEAIDMLQAFICTISADILQECKSMKRQMENHISLEALLNDLGERSRMTDIMDFAKVFATAKKSGGDLNAMIANTADVIGQKIELLAEIDVMLTGKKMEQRIMLLIPLFIMGYISLTSPGYFMPLYQNPMGILIMSACLLLYATAYLLSEKIMEIHI